MPIETAPGEECQFDWSDCCDFGELFGLGELHCFGAILSWSRWRKWWFAASIDRNHTLEGLASFYEAVGGVPYFSRTDRMGALGTSRGRRFVLAPACSTSHACTHGDGGLCFDFVKEERRVGVYYFYLADADFGAGSIKVCAPTFPTLPRSG